MPRRPRSTPRGEPVVQWTTRNMPATTLAEVRAVAAMTELLPHPISVEAVVNTAILMGLATLRLVIERRVAKYIKENPS